MTSKEEALALINRFGFWNEHPDYPVDDWKLEVANSDTRAGYWDWVVGKIEQTKGPGHG